jgi:hypothetical protein
MPGPGCAMPSRPRDRQFGGRLAPHDLRAGPRRGGATAAAAASHVAVRTEPPTRPPRPHPRAPLPAAAAPQFDFYCYTQLNATMEKVGRRAGRRGALVPQKSLNPKPSLRPLGAPKQPALPKTAPGAANSPLPGPHHPLLPGCSTPTGPPDPTSRRPDVAQPAAALHLPPNPWNPCSTALSPQVFFPTDNETIQALSFWGVYALAFVIRCGRGADPPPLLAPGPGAARPGWAQRSPPPRHAPGIKA